MAEVQVADAATRQRQEPDLGRAVVGWLTTTDHNRIGTLYLATSFVIFLVGGAFALVMRAELARPCMQLLSNGQFNQAFTGHGTIMLLIFATPLFAGFANWIMPLQIGAPDVAFPRLNMLAYWRPVHASRPLHELPVPEVPGVSRQESTKVDRAEDGPGRASAHRLAAATSRVLGCPDRQDHRRQGRRDHHR